MTFGGGGGPNGTGGTGGTGQRTPGGGSRPAGAPTGSFPRRPNGTGTGTGTGGFDPTTMILQRLGLDTSDPTVKAAVDACTPALTAALPSGGGAPGGQPPAESTTTTA